MTGTGDDGVTPLVVKQGWSTPHAFNFCRTIPHDADTTNILIREKLQTHPQFPGAISALWTETVPFTWARPALPYIASSAAKARAQQVREEKEPLEEKQAAAGAHAELMVTLSPSLLFDPRATQHEYDEELRRRRR